MRPLRYLLLLAAAAVGTAAATWLFNRVAARPAVTDRYQFVMERKIAARVASGKNVVLPGDINEWMLRWKIARRLPGAPDAAVLGSSHSLPVTADMLGAPDAMNFSISGSAMADHLLTTEILAERGLHPRTWVIFVDAWFFDLGADFGAWHDEPAEVLRMEDRLRQTAQPPLEPIFTRSQDAWARRAHTDRYALAPLLRTFDGWINEVALSAEVVGQADGSATVICGDGSVRSSSHAELDPADVRSVALHQFRLNADRHRYGKYDRIDEDLWRYFEAWVRFCRQDGGRVWLVLSPYHPAIYPEIVAVPQNQLKAIESRLHAFARQAGVGLLGSYDPAQAGMSGADFYDGDHLLKGGLQRLLAPIAASAATAAP